MFSKKSDESEWSRFSRTLPSRESGRDETAADTAQDPAPATAPGAASAARPAPATDVNLSVARAPQRPVSNDLVDDVESVIGEFSTFEGTFKSENSVRVRGKVQGELESKRAVFIEESARVNAKVTGASIVVAGEVDGQLNCVGRVEIKPTGRVMGEIHAGTLKMDEGAFFEGQLKMVKPEGQAASSAGSFSSTHS